MRTMFAVGHQTGTHTRIVIRGRRRDDRRAAAAKPERPVAHRPARPEVAVEAPAQGMVH